jgi:hypothetical protein
MRRIHWEPVMFQTMARPTASLVAVLLLFSPLNWTHGVPLASRSVRDASLGQRNDEKTEPFLESYTRRFAVPPQGPYISEICLLTPYAQALDISRHKTAGDGAQQAKAEYKARGDAILVRVRIDFTPTSLSLACFVGAYVNLDYDARSVPSQKPQLEIFTPDGQHVVASFDLAALR